jgi:hypothetical protein
VGPHAIRRLSGGTTTVHRPVVGELRLHREKLPVDGLTLVVYYADARSADAEKLRLLASRVTTSEDDDGSPDQLETSSSEGLSNRHA